MTARAWRNHAPCAGGCGELADECMTPGCGSPLGGMTIEPPIGSAARPTTDWWQTNAEHLGRTAAAGNHTGGGTFDTAAPVITDWTAEGHRPAGQPGEVGRNHGAGASWTYPAVKTEDGRVLYWRDTTDSAGRWLAAPTLLAASFQPGPEWQSSCDHAHGVGYRTCDTETDCISLRREDERRWGR